MNTELNAFLALLEGRPETFRDLLRGEKRSHMLLPSIQERIHQAAENIRCQAVKTAIREVYNATLRLTPLEDKTIDLDSYFTGVQDVEEILARALKTCEEAEKKFGPAPTVS